MTKKVNLEHVGEAQHELAHTVLSTVTLLKASASAAVLAAIVLVGAILPVEYGIDLTGIGEAAGLMPLASSVAEPVNTESARQAVEDLAYQENRVNITVPAGDGLEYKFHLVKGDTMRYAWSSSDAELFFDFHGEPAGDTSGYFESYTVSTSNDVRGSFTAPFDGSHGWYWENKGSSPAIVTLITEGKYTILGIR